MSNGKPVDPGKKIKENNIKNRSKVAVMRKLKGSTDASRELENCESLPVFVHRSNTTKMQYWKKEEKLKDLLEVE